MEQETSPLVDYNDDDVTKGGDIDHLIKAVTEVARHLS